MKNQARTALVGAVLTVGFVSPFLAGLIAERQLRASRVDVSAPDEPAYPCAGPEIPFLLDYGRSLARARVSRKPVLLYFTAVNSIDTRVFEVNVLKSPAVLARLGKFECAAVVLDIVPHSDASEAARIYSQNQKLREQFFDDQGLRWRQTIAVVRPEFDGTPASGARQLLAKAVSWELTNDPSIVGRFLDDALRKWSESKK